LLATDVFGDRLMVGRQSLKLPVEVRPLLPELSRGANATPLAQTARYANLAKRLGSEPGDVDCGFDSHSRHCLRGGLAVERHALCLATLVRSQPPDLPAVL